MFTRAPYRYGEPPNSLTDPVVLGMPGTLPVMNIEAIEKSIRLGLMFDSHIPDVTKWDRKHYFYPDMPKNYQISQYDEPICQGGEVEIELPGESRNVMGEHKMVRLTRAHLEEDVGKLTHESNESLVDYNRAGAPLLEIVTEPDIRSSEEAFAFLTSLRMHIVSAGLADCDMEKGGMRCDANVSVRKIGAKEFGTKIELKNLNTISGVRNGIDYEIKRQIKAVEAGETLIQETRRWDAERGVSISMRKKEYAHDYRYFPDPDLMPVKIDDEWRNRLRSELPEKPFDKQRRFMDEYKLPYTVTSVLCPDRALADYFEATVSSGGEARIVANFIANDVLRELSALDKSIEASPVSSEALAGLAKQVDSGTISKQIAQDVLVEMFKTGESADAIIESKGLKQSSDPSELESHCREAIGNNAKAVEQYQSGNEKAINALKGPIMKAMKGKANPKMVDEILKKLINDQ